MRTTFIIAQKLCVSPFEVMAQDIEHVIMIANFLIESASESNTHDNTVVSTEKEKDKDFWSAL